MGNVAAGFDVLGAALQPLDGTLWGDVVEAEPAPEPELRCTGPFADRLPPITADNLVEKTRAVFAAVLGRPLPPLRLTLHKHLPVSSGLGSSSSSVVATVVALDAACGHPLTPQQKLMVAGRAEGQVAGAMHLDNVAPSLLGGLRLITPSNQAVALPWPEDLRLVVASPDLQLETRRSRGVLPREVPLALAVAHAQNLAGLVHALHQDDRQLLQATVRDLLAEPYRASLVPGFRQAQQAALDAGALACSLSGAGPAVFAVADDAHASLVAAALRAGFAAAEVQAVTRVCRLDLQGAREL